jgi:hypothetical protein
MNKIIKIATLGVLTIAAVGGILFAPKNVSADEAALTVSVSPTRQRIDLNPGEISYQAITVINDNDVPLTVTLTAAPYSVADPSYNTQDFTTESARTQISRWITFPTPTITVAPHSSVAAPYNVETPKDVAAGGQYAALFVNLAPGETKNTGSASISISKRTGVLLYANVKGKTRESGKILSWNVPGLVLDNQIVAKLKFANDGNTDYDVTTTMRASNLFGRQVYESGSSTHTILPNTTREMDDLAWSNPTAGIYYVTENISWLDQVVVKGQWVVVAPIWLFIVIIVALLGIVFGIIGIVTTTRNRRNQTGALKRVKK